MNKTQNEPQAGPLTVETIRSRATLSVEEMGEVLGIGRTSAYAAVKRGEVPTIRLGRRVRVPVPALLRLLGDDGGYPSPAHLQVQHHGQLDAEALGKATNGR